MSRHNPNGGIIGNRNFTSARRWSVKNKGGPRMAEECVTPDEARTALHAACLGIGIVVEDVTGYDPRSDKFECRGRDADGKLHHVEIRGEAVAKIVAAARTMSNAPKGLPRSENMQRGGKGKRLLYVP